MMIRTGLIARCLISMCLMAFASFAQAQSTGGVFGPDIRASDKTGEWRVAYAPEDDGRDDAWSSRIHYQHALSDQLRARLVLSGDDIETGSFESTFLQAELQWQFKKPSEQSNWASALRFDTRINEGDDGIDFVGLNWTSRVPLNEKLTGKFVLLTAKQIGERANDGISLETRMAADYKLNNGLSLGVHSFNGFGNTTNLGSFNDQNHRLGPTLSGKINDETSFLFGPLFGLSDRARDVDVRFWLTRRFD